MDRREIVRQRLFNQQIAETKFNKAAEIVSNLGAMQAQEYAMAKWAIGLRLPGITDAQIEKQFNDGKILRTHLLRPTWHFVAPSDIRWLLKLTAPRVDAAKAFMYRKLELDDKVFSATQKILERSLSGGRHLTRDALNEEFLRNKIVASGLRLGYIFMRAEIDGLICSGPRLGKQFSYALLEERVPKVKLFPERDEALSALAHRYFSSRGPATLKDFVTWSGMTVKDAKAGVATLGKTFECIRVDGIEYIGSPRVIKSRVFQSTFLMPDYDEYVMGYKDRSAIMPEKTSVMKKVRSSSEYTRWLVVDGRIGGSWTRSVKGKKIGVEATSFLPAGKEHDRSVKNALKRFATFVGNEPPEE